MARPGNEVAAEEEEALHCTVSKENVLRIASVRPSSPLNEKRVPDRTRNETAMCLAVRCGVMLDPKLKKREQLDETRWDETLRTCGKGEEALRAETHMPLGGLLEEGDQIRATGACAMVLACSVVLPLAIQPLVG
jgi:hypothetical protein